MRRVLWGTVRAVLRVRAGSPRADCSGIRHQFCGDLAPDTWQRRASSHRQVPPSPPSSPFHKPAAPLPGCHIRFSNSAARCLTRPDHLLPRGVLGSHPILNCCHLFGRVAPIRAVRGIDIGLIRTCHDVGPNFWAACSSTPARQRPTPRWAPHIEWCPSLGIATSPCAWGRSQASSASPRARWRPTNGNSPTTRPRS